MASTPARHFFRRSALLLVSIALLWPGSLVAELYKYRGKDGGIVITTEKRRDLKLIEVIDGGFGKKKPKKRSRRAKSPRSSSPKRVKGSVGTPRHARSTAKESLYDPIIREASGAYGLPFSFVKAVVKVESNFNPRAVSRVGAQGLMQLMPKTAESLGVEDSFDPRQNIFGGARYLRMMTNRYNGDINMVLSAYNAGPGNVDKYSGIPFDSTQRYVRDVYQWYQVYKKQHPTPPTPPNGVESHR